MPLEATRCWTKYEQKQLIKLREIYGMNRPSDICHQLKQIYGIEKTPQQVLARITRLNPNIDRTKLNEEQLLEVWELQKKIGFDWNKIGQKLNKDKNFVRENIIIKYRSFLRKLNSVYGQENRQHNKNKLRILKMEALSFYLQLYKDNNPPQDEQYLQVKEKATQFVEIFDKMFRIQFDSDEDLFEKLKNFTNKQQIQQMFEHLYLLDTMLNISQNKALNKIYKNKNQYNPYTYITKNDQKIMTKFGGVKTWEEAENLMMKPKSQFEDYDKKINLSQNEIQLIKESPLYQKLFPNLTKKFFDFYNEAVANYQENKNFTYMINQNIKLLQVKKDINLEDYERQKQNIPIPIWKKHKNERTVNIAIYSKRFLNDFLESVHQ